MFRTLFTVHLCTLSATPASMTTRGEVKDPSDWRRFGTGDSIERLPCVVSLHDHPLLNLRLFIGGFYAKGFLQCLYTVARLYYLNCFTVLLIFMPACWCKLDISIECLTVKVIFSVNSQFDTNIILQEVETKQGGTYV